MAQVSHKAKSNTSPTGRVRVFSTPVPDDYRGPDWPDDTLRDWLSFYVTERAASLEAGTDRTGATVAFCDARIDAMLAELARRQRLAQKFQDDPRGPTYEDTGANRRAGLIDLARDLKRIWSIDRFITQMMRVDLIRTGPNRWKCRCFLGVHDDTNPSMVVYGDDDHVHCYSCQYHGDVLDITKTYFGLTSFVEAVRRLAAATDVEA